MAQTELPAPLASRAVSPRFQTLTMADGLSLGAVFDIFQDRSGFMWFTTQDGLNRWDGYEMKIFKHQPFDTTTLSSSWLGQIDQDESGALWIGTRSGLDRMDPLTETFTSYIHDPEDPTSISPGLVWEVAVGLDGSVWVNPGEDGLDRMRPESPGVFEHFRHDPEDPTSITDNRIWSLDVDDEGYIWAGTPNGLNRINPETSEVRRYFQIEDTVGCGPTGAAFVGMFTAADVLERPEEPGILWVATEIGLARLDTDTGEFTIHGETDDDPCGSEFYGLVQDPLNPGILWGAASEKGIKRFDIRSETYQTYGYDPDNESSLPEGFARRLFVDRSGVVWVQTNPTGVAYFDPASIGMALHKRVPDNPNTLGGTAITSMHLGRDGILWVTSSETDHWELTALDRAAGTAEHYVHDPDDPSSISRGFHWADIVEDQQGYIWVGTPDFGLDRLDRQTGNFRRYRHHPDDPGSIASDRTHALYVDHAGSLWVGHRGAVSRMNPASPDRFIRYIGVEEDEGTIFAGNRLVRSITEDQAGFIWLAMHGGVVRMDPISGRAKRYRHDPEDPTTLASDVVSHVVERRAEPGVVWIGMYGGGLDRLDVETGEIRHFTEREGLANNGVYGALEDEQGRLWISTNGGISRFDPATETFRNYGLEIGLQGLEFNSGAFHRGHTGELFFGGNFGLNSFFPNEIKENTKAPQVTLVDLKLFNESVAKSGAVALSASLVQTEEITFRHDQSDIEFDFVAFHYADPGSNEYAYKLEGWNDDWVFVGNKRSASFTNLDPGEYTFRVKAANSDGVWNDEGTSIRIVVTPPFWATWWFRILGLLAFAGVIYGGYRLRTAQLEARARELEGEVGARTAQLKASNEQLEQSHGIVTAINQETSFSSVLTKILEEARVIPGVEKATGLVYMPAEGVFRVRASSGWDVDAMSDIVLTDRQARRRYVEDAEEVAQDIFVAKNVSGREGADQMAEFGEVASFLVLRINVEGEVAGYLVFDNLTDPDAFDARDVAILERLRQHIQSAFIKTRILEDLQTTLADLRSTQDRLVQSEKMASLGELTAGIAHEIKNPLNFVNNFAEIAAELAEEAKEAESPDRLTEILDELRENAIRIEQHAKRADAIVENMMQHAAGSGAVEPTDINALLEEYIGLAFHGFKARHKDFDVEVKKDLDPGLRKLNVVPQEIGKVLMNLINNAFDAMRTSEVGGRASEVGGRASEVGGRASDVKPTLRVATSRNGSSVEIRISDNGPGIPPEVKSKIFEPFFTTKPTGSGTGLGLSMSYDIVTKGHGGQLDVESEEGSGATFIVRLPA